MAYHVYIKKDNSFKKKTINNFSYLFLIIGSLLLFWSFYPIISFQIYSRIFLKNSLKSPVGRETVSVLNEANSVLGGFNIFSNNLRDYTQASVWFPVKSQAESFLTLNVKEYFLSIQTALREKRSRNSAHNFISTSTAAATAQVSCRLPI